MIEDEGGNEGRRNCLKMRHVSEARLMCRGVRWKMMAGEEE